RMYLDSANFIVGLSHQGGNIQDTGGRSFIRLRLFDAKQQLHARLPTGAMLDTIEISWSPDQPRDKLFSGNNVVVGKATLTALADTGLLDRAIDQLVSNDDRGQSSLFAANALHGRRMIDALFSEFPNISE
ncbi:MAG: hypothetical protein ACR2QW_14875, partial [bacterium]